MRTLKFRAWDKRESKFWAPIIDLLGFPCAIHPVSQQLIRMDGDLLDPVEQFTGLHDRNGKEIYEGDILSDGTFVSKVQFSVDRYISTPISWKDGVTNLNIWLLRRHKAGCPVYIVGNIHEKPELLESEPCHTKD